MRKFYGTLIENNKPINGIWFLDDKNLTFNKRSLGTVVWFGFMADTITTGKKYFSLPLSDIDNVEYFKFRLNNHAIRITTKEKNIELVSNNHKKLFQLLKNNF